MNLEPLHELGFVLLKGAIPQPTIDAFEDEVRRLTEAQLAARGITPKGDREALIELYELGGKYRHVLYTVMQYLSSMTALKARVLELFAGGGALADLGFQVPITTNALRVDLPGEARFNEPMHQGYSSYAPPAYHAWVPLRRVDEHFGSVRVCPGSHKGGFVPHDTSDPRRPRLAPEHYQGMASEVVEADAGDVLVFNAYVFHASVPNRSNRIKFIGGFIAQDLANLADPEDPDSPVWDMVSMTGERQKRNKEAAGQ